MFVSLKTRVLHLWSEERAEYPATDTGATRALRQAGAVGASPGAAVRGEGGDGQTPSEVWLCAGAAARPACPGDGRLRTSTM